MYMFQNIAVHDPTFLAFRTLSELFPTGQSVFMMGSPHYGCQGEVGKTLSELFPTGQSVFMMGSPHYGCQGEVC
jgi:hypothetical protein